MCVCFIYMLYNDVCALYTCVSHTHTQCSPSLDVLFTMVPLIFLALRGLLPYGMKNHSPKNQAAIPCQSLANTAHTYQGSQSHQVKLWGSYNMCFIKMLMNSQFLTRILGYRKPNLNLQKAPLTLLALALTQITTLMVRNNVLLCCQVF